MVVFDDLDKNIRQRDTKCSRKVVDGRRREERGPEVHRANRKRTRGPIQAVDRRRTQWTVTEVSGYSPPPFSPHKMCIGCDLSLSGPNLPRCASGETSGRRNRTRDAQWPCGNLRTSRRNAEKRESEVKKPHKNHHVYASIRSILFSRVVCVYVSVSACVYLCEFAAP